MKYIIYCRKSTDTEDKQVLSLESQENELKRLAEAHELEVIEILKESRSAKEPDRPIFNSMMKKISSGKADAILCWKIDRLTRNPVDGGQIQWLLQNNKIKCIRTFEKSYFPNDNVLLMSIEQAMANQYIRDLSVNVKRGNRAKLERGEWPNHAPLGYFNDKATKTVQIDKQFAPYVVRAYELYLTGGYTLKQITKVLYDEGLRTKTGGMCRTNQIHRFFLTRFYCGLMERDGKIYDGKHKAIITISQFNQAQEVLHGRSHPHPKKYFYSAQGFLRCEVCGCALTVDTRKGFKYYYCTNGKGVCDQHKGYMRSEYVDKALSDMFKVLKFDEEIIDISYEAYKAENMNKADYVNTGKDNLLNELKGLTEKESLLVDSYTSQVLRKDLYEQKMLEVENRRTELKKQLKEIELKGAVPESTIEQVKNIFLDGNKASEKYLQIDEYEKRKMLEKLLSNATFKNKSVAQYFFKNQFEILAKTPKNCDLPRLLRGLESNQDS